MATQSLAGFGKPILQPGVGHRHGDPCPEYPRLPPEPSASPWINAPQDPTVSSATAGTATIPIDRPAVRGIGPGLLATMAKNPANSEVPWLRFHPQGAGFSPCTFLCATQTTRATMPRFSALTRWDGVGVEARRPVATRAPEAVQFMELRGFSRSCLTRRSKVRAFGSPEAGSTKALSLCSTNAEDVLSTKPAPKNPPWSASLWPLQKARHRQRHRRARLQVLRPPVPLLQANGATEAISVRSRPSDSGSKTARTE